MKFNTSSLIALYMKIIETVPIEIDDLLKKTLKKALSSFGPYITSTELELFTNYLTCDLEILGYITVQLLEIHRDKKGYVALSKKDIDLYTNLVRKYVKNMALFDRRTKNEF